MIEVTRFNMEFQPEGVVRECVYASNYDTAISQLAALREELGQCKGEYDRSANRVSELQDQLACANKSANTYLAAWEKCAEFRDASEQRLADAERRNELLESQVLHKDAGIEFRDVLINAVRMSSKELLMAWVPSDWEAKRASLFSAALNKPEEAKS